MAMAIDPRVGCSSISFRARPLRDALDVINGLGFTEIDLGALPGVCDHVPYDLTPAAVEQVADDIAASGLSVRSVNGDVATSTTSRMPRAAPPATYISHDYSNSLPG